MKPFIATAVCTVFIFTLVIPIFCELDKKITELKNPPVSAIAQEIDPAITADEITLIENYLSTLKGDNHER